MMVGRDGAAFQGLSQRSRDTQRSGPPAPRGWAISGVAPTELEDEPTHDLLNREPREQPAVTKRRNATVREAEYYVEAGMTPLQAIRAATIQPATMLGINETVGTIEVGKVADIIAVSEDPSVNIQALRDIRFVMQGGNVIRNDIGT